MLVVRRDGTHSIRGTGSTVWRVFEEKLEGEICWILGEHTSPVPETGRLWTVPMARFGCSAVEFPGAILRESDLLLAV